jgi:hypothetical protein
MPEVEWGSRGAEKVFRDNEQLRKSVESTGDAYKDTMREAQELGRIASRIAKDNETAQERFTRQLVNAKRALDADKISTEQLGRETTRLTVEFLRATDGSRRLTAAQMHQLEVKRRLQQQTLHEIATMAALKSSTEQLMGEHTLAGAALDGVANAGERAYGGPAQASIGGMIGKVRGWQVVLAAVVKSLRDAEMRSIAVGERILEMEPRSKSLAEEARGDPARLAQLRAAADQTFREGAFATRDEARGLQAALAGAGLEGDRAFFSRFQEIGDAATIAGLIGKVRSGFGAGEAGGAAAIASKATAAARAVSGGSRAQILGEVDKAAEAARQFGLSDEATFALVSRISERDRDDAGGRAATLLRSLTKRGFAGQPIDVAVESIAGRGLSERGLGKMLGTRQAETFGMIGGAAGLRARMGSIDAAQRSNLAEQEIQAQLAQESVGLARSRRASLAETELLQERRAIRSAASAADRELNVARTESRFGVLGPLLGQADRVLGEVGQGFVSVTGARPSVAGPSMNELAEQLRVQNALVREQNQIMNRDERRAPVPTGRRE